MQRTAAHARPVSLLRRLQFPAAIMAIFWAIAFFLWRKTGTTFYLFDLGYIGSSLGLGIGLYELLPRQKKPIGRRVAQFLVGLPDRDKEVQHGLVRPSR